MSRKPPSYRLHKSSGLAVVRFGSQDFYLGKHGTPESHERYDRLVAEWLAAGRVIVPQEEPLSVAELAESYLAFAEGYYRKDGVITSEYENIKMAFTYLTPLYATVPVAEFGPIALQVVRQKMIEADLARNTINALCRKIRAAFKWGVDRQLCLPSVYQALQCVPGLRRGRSDARETEPIGPVSVAVYEETLPHLTQRIADILRVQRLSGCRPGEAAGLRGNEIDTSGELWVCRPKKHKTQHYEKDKIIVFGPAAQEILRPYLLKCGGGFLFPGKSGRPLLVASLTAAIREACKRHDIPHWHANQLRHLRATEVRAGWGIDAARAMLGHAHISTAEIYAAPNLGQLKDIMRAMG